LSFFGSREIVAALAQFMPSRLSGSERTGSSADMMEPISLLRLRSRIRDNFCGSVSLYSAETCYFGSDAMIADRELLSSAFNDGN
jgi:hypothetical protein